MQMKVAPRHEEKMPQQRAEMRSLTTGPLNGLVASVPASSALMISLMVSPM